MFFFQYVLIILLPLLMFAVFSWTYFLVCINTVHMDIAINIIFIEDIGIILL